MSLITIQHPEPWSQEETERLGQRILDAVVAITGEKPGSIVVSMEHKPGLALYMDQVLWPSSSAMQQSPDSLLVGQAKLNSMRAVLPAQAREVEDWSDNGVELPTRNFGEKGTKLVGQDFEQLKQAIVNCLHDSNCSSLELQRRLNLKGGPWPARIRRVMALLQTQGLVKVAGVKRGQCYIWQGTLAKPLLQKANKK
jgi:hypothetical protein